MNINQVIEALSKQYNFSKEDAKIYIQRLSENNVSSKQTIRTKMILPFCGVICEGKCKNLKVNHGLFTQCTNKIMNNDDNLCKTCDNLISKNSGKYPIGKIEDRMLGDPMKFKSNSGKMVTSFGDVIKKLQISRKDAEKFASEQGLVIPESQFVESKKKRGRPRKEVSTYDTDNDEQSENDSINKNNNKSENINTPPVVKRGRGRPKKDKKIIVTKTTQNDYISELYKEAENKFPDCCGDNNNESNNDKSSIDESSSDESSSDESSSDEEHDDSDSDIEQIDVVCVTFDKKQYLKSVEDNLIYDRETEEHVGYWKDNKIVFK